MREKNETNNSFKAIERVNKFIIHFLKNTVGIFLVLGGLGYIGGIVLKGIDSIFSAVIPEWQAFSLAHKVIYGLMIFGALGIILTVFGEKISFKKKTEKIPILGWIVVVLGTMAEIIKNAKPVFFELVPGTKRYGLGFTNNNSIKDPFEGESELNSCFWPNSPFPVTGPTVFVPSSDLKDANLTTIEALAKISTAGFHSIKRKK